MAKRANYGFVKRQKELKRQQKKEEKAEKKRLKQNLAGGDDQSEVVDGSDEDLGLVDQAPRPEE